MLDFQQYQYAFTAHIRDPKKNPKPDNVDEERMSVYREGVYNNVFESTSVCFPVCQKTLGETAWDDIMRCFFATHHASSPIFREIPQELLAFMQADEKVPEYIKQLAHYEWVELAVSMQKTSAPNMSEAADLLNEVPVITPAHMLLQYDYPVQKISPKFIPENKEDTYLLVFRNQDFEVNFIEFNPMTYVLLELIKQGLTGKQALTSLAEQIQHPEPNVVLEFGHGLLLDLFAKNAILGSTTINPDKCKIP